MPEYPPRIEWEPQSQARGRAPVLMPTILEELKSRLATAQARQALAQQRWQAAQAEINAANGEVNIWNNALAVETRDEAVRVAEAAKNDVPAAVQTSFEAVMESEQPETPVTESQPDEEDEQVNKTELVRDLLRENPTGMTPAAIWTAFHQQAPKASRNYMYSVLKRLRDKKQVEQKRGKYMLKAKPAVTVDETFVGGAATVN